MAEFKAFEILELEDGQSIRFRVLRWQVGETDIQLRYMPKVKHIRYLTVYVPPEDKPIGPPYWDITSTTLQAQIEPLLPEAQRTGRYIEIRAYGVEPKKRFTVKLI